MILSLLIIFTLLLSIYGGVRRGVIVQLTSLFGFTLNFWIALTNYPKIQHFISLLVPYPSGVMTEGFVFYTEDIAINLDTSFYGLLSFVLIFLALIIFVKILTYIFRPLALGETYPKLEYIGGGLISFVIAYVIIFIFLFLLSTIPLDFIQNLLSNSFMARFIIEHTPVLSNMFMGEWIL